MLAFYLSLCFFFFFFYFVFCFVYCLCIKSNQIPSHLAVNQLLILRASRLKLWGEYPSFVSYQSYLNIFNSDSVNIMHFSSMAAFKRDFRVNIPTEIPRHNCTGCSGASRLLSAWLAVFHQKINNVFGLNSRLSHLPNEWNSSHPIPSAPYCCSDFAYRSAHTRIHRARMNLTVHLLKQTGSAG